ncbi:hypothetical protein [Streptomyces orinoci]|uniref:Restriction endonuclease type IV Mrr domain-containing protein n=1 Tax=Streptomyces orinoci TaxID=67339 RepID=A0ABV3JZI4_STRON|nr:hypothetical protein [Streptomyces orinoci]
MAKRVPVHCPMCHREHSYTPPTFPCACGTPLTLPVPADACPGVLTSRSWRDSWVTVRCPDCGTQGQWPRPEFGCACGAVVQLPLAQEPRAQEPRAETPARHGRTRPAFRPVTIRTERDALLAAERYLRWLGFARVRRTDNCAAHARSAVVDLRAEGLVVRVDSTTLPTTVRDIECLWLYGLAEDATALCFSVAGYTYDARCRADALGLPLFVLDLTGAPRPLNDPAERLTGGRQG